MKKVEQIEMPVNSNERFLYAIAMRLEILIDQVGALSEHIAKRDGVATESNVAEVKVEQPAEEKPKKPVRKKVK